MRAVNLLPIERRGGARQDSLAAAVTRRPLLVGAAAIMIAAVGAVALLHHSASSRVSAKRAELQQAEAALAQAQKASRAASGPTQSDVAARLGAVESAASPRTTWDGLLGSLSRVMPEDIWLDSLSMTSPGTAAAAVASGPTGSTTPTGFVISGYTYSHRSVARLMRRLSLVPWLTGVALTSSERSDLAGRTVFKFSVGATVQSPGTQS